MLVEDLDSLSLSSQDEVIEQVFYDLLDELSLSLCFHVHKMVKTGVFELLEMQEDRPRVSGKKSSGGQLSSATSSSDTAGAAGAASSSSSSSSSSNSTRLVTDVFGQVIQTTVSGSEVPFLKKQPECVCPNCGRNMAASRFAPHLEKCMGTGRNSSRLANRRMANSTKDNYRDGDNPDDADDAEDEDWMEPSGGGGGGSKSGGGGSAGNNRRKRDKNSPRRNKGPKSRGGNSGADDGTLTPPTSFEQLGMEERSHWLASICGVLSQTTASARSSKVCTRSHTRCGVHTDAQRREVRIRLLSSGGGSAAAASSTTGEEEEAHVDIDSFAEGDTAALRESLALLSNASSPAESTISTSSNPSTSAASATTRTRREKRGRGGGGGGKKGRPGSKNGSRGSTPPMLNE